MIKSIYGKELVSIHAPGRGATTKWITTRHFIGGFNSRTREGCD